MRRSLIYLSLAGALASVAVVIAIGTTACAPLPNCLFLPQINGAPRLSTPPTLTATVFATSTPTTSPAPTANSDATLTATPDSANPAPITTATPTQPANSSTTAVPDSTATATAAATAVTLKGLAILGDSTQDEYQADNPRGGAFTANTLNWVEQLVRFRGLNLGTPGTRPEPRRSGYDYNWARSGATSADMISKGQHTGAAEQIQAGNVSHVAIQIGINDFYFSGLGAAIYSGTISSNQIKIQLDKIVANIALATRTVHAANPRGVLLVAMQDYITLPIIPELQFMLASPAASAGRQRTLDAFNYLNDELRKVAAQEGVPFFDYNAVMLAEMNARRDSQGFLVVGGQRIDLNKRGNDPHFGILDDGYVHPGTVLSGLSANVYIQAFNREFGTNITPFTDAEILRAAGIVS